METEGKIRKRLDNILEVDFTKAASSTGDPVPEGGAKLISYYSGVKDSPPLMSIQQKPSMFSDLEIPYLGIYGDPLPEGQELQEIRGEKAWASIQRFCVQQGLSDSERYSYILMFLADCMLIDATRPIDSEDAQPQSFSSGTWAYNRQEASPQTPCRHLYLSQETNSWENMRVDKYTDAELDVFESNYGVLPKLYDFFGSLEHYEWGQFLNNVPAWKRLKRYSPGELSLKTATLFDKHYVTLPSDISDLRDVRPETERQAFYGPGRVYSYENRDFWKNEGCGLAKPAGGRIYTP